MSATKNKKEYITQEIQQEISNRLSSIKKTPILSKICTSRMVKEFKKIKIQLKEKKYPINKTRKLVSSLLKLQIDHLTKYLSKDSVLITVPSGSGINIIPMLISKELQKVTKCQVLPANTAWKLHSIEAKHNLALDQRIKDPIEYDVNPNVVKKIIGKPLFIVDDVIATGESCIKLSNQLNKYGAITHGFVGIITVEKYYTSQNDIERITNKIASYLNLNKKETLNLAIKCCNVFGPYTRKKLRREELTIYDYESALKSYKTIDQANQLMTANLDKQQTKKKINKIITIQHNQ